MRSMRVKRFQNGCPSEGTVDIFIEPHTPAPQLVIYGKAPVAQALKKLAPNSAGWLELPTMI